MRLLTMGHVAGADMMGVDMKTLPAKAPNISPRATRLELIAGTSDSSEQRRRELGPDPYWRRRRW